MWAQTADKEFLIMHRHHNFYILKLAYIIMCTAAYIFIEGHMWPYGRRLCTPALEVHLPVLRGTFKVSKRREKYIHFRVF